MENARPLPKEESSAPNSANSTGSKAFTPRQTRVLQALLCTDGWIPRESIDRIAGASNGPQIILELRRKVAGADGIEMTHIETQDSDGRTCKPGQYRLTGQGRERALQVLSSLSEAA
jgi:hypothetical protein